VGTVRLGAFSASSSTVFFRLWNGIRLISDFTNSVSPQELLDGIQLVFEPATAINYAPGDYWTFAVRAGEITNPAVLVDNLHPFGPVYQRVPLAEIDWGTAGAPVVPPQIEDCRRRFRPLTRLETCCTVRVGKDGLGDFTSVQDAINALPPEGGKICILPGEYQEQKPITLDNRQNITISGCGPRTRLVAAASASGADAVITIHGGNRLAIESLAIEASPTGRGILALGHNKFSQVAQVATGLIEGLSLKGLELKASALAAVRAEFVNDLLMRECVVRMEDTHCNENAVVVLADHAHLEHNVIEVPGRETHSPATATVGGSRFVPGTRNLGGLHLKSLCHRVRVIDNLIRGGSGNGITLGSQAWYFDGDRNKPVPLEKEPEVPAGDPCDPLLPIDLVFLGRTVEIGDGIRIRLGAGGPLYHLRVERNRIYGMGSNGIAVIGFFDLSATDEFITVLDLSILGNEIRGCLRRTITQPSDSLRDYLGYGGIALADVQNLVVQDNTIVDNGRNHLDPVCGVFVLHGKGIDLSRNRIAGNGKRTSEGPTNARRGHRGGVVIPFALSPTIEIIVGETTFPVPNGVAGGSPASEHHFCAARPGPHSERHRADVDRRQSVDLAWCPDLGPGPHRVPRRHGVHREPRHFHRCPHTVPALRRTGPEAWRGTRLQFREGRSIGAPWSGRFRSRPLARERAGVVQRQPVESRPPRWGPEPGAHLGADLDARRYRVSRQPVRSHPQQRHPHRARSALRIVAAHRG
jgi:hypothetical protein